MRKVPAVYRDGACGWCGGRGLVGYKNRPRYVKCLRCKRVCYQLAAAYQLRYESTSTRAS